jgi:hypothetical protein
MRISGLGFGEGAGDTEADTHGAATDRAAHATGIIIIIIIGALAGLSHAFTTTLTLLL